MSKNILLTEIKRNDMGLPLNKLLDEYFRADELQDVLRDIGESTSGTKKELIKRVHDNWESHNRDIYELLDFIDKDYLQMICYHYNLDATKAKHDVLKRRIKKANLLGSGGKASSQVDDSRSFKKPKIKAENNSQVTDVHFHIGSVTHSKWGKIGVVSTIVGIAIMIILFAAG